MKTPKRQKYKAYQIRNLNAIVHTGHLKYLSLIKLLNTVHVVTCYDLTILLNLKKWTRHIEYPNAC